MKTFKEFINEGRFTPNEMEIELKKEIESFFKTNQYEIEDTMGNGDFEVILKTPGKNIKDFIKYLKSGPFRGKGVGYEINDETSAFIRHPQAR